MLLPVRYVFNKFILAFRSRPPACVACCLCIFIAFGITAGVVPKLFFAEKRVCSVVDFVCTRDVAMTFPFPKIDGFPPGNSLLRRNSSLILGFNSTNSTDFNSTTPDYFCNLILEVSEELSDVNTTDFLVAEYLVTYSHSLSLEIEFYTAQYRCWYFF